MSPGLGGLELYFFRATLKLLGMGSECIPVVALDSRLEEQFKKNNVDSVTLNRGSRYLPLSNALRLARLVDSHNIDVIHMHWAKDLALAVLMKLFSHHKPKLVYTRHMEIYGDKKDLYHRFVYRYIDLMLTVTKRMAKQAEASLPLPPKRIQALYLGIPIYEGNRVKDRTEFRSKYKIPENAFLVGMVGRIESGKRQHILLESLESLVNEIPNLHCAVVGSSKNQEYLNKLKSRVENGPLRNRVSFVGFFDRPRTAMAAFDVAVLATYCETFGLVLIEAMSTCTAAIGSRACGVQEIIEDGVNGLMFDPDNAEDLANKIRTLYRDGALREKLALAGKESVTTHFNEDAHYKKLAAFFEHTLENN